MERSSNSMYRFSAILTHNNHPDRYLCQILLPYIMHSTNSLPFNIRKKINSFNGRKWKIIYRSIGMVPPTPTPHPQLYSFAIYSTHFDSFLFLSVLQSPVSIIPIVRQWRLDRLCGRVSRKQPQVTENDSVASTNSGGGPSDRFSGRSRVGGPMPGSFCMAGGLFSLLSFKWAGVVCFDLIGQMWFALF